MQIKNVARLVRPSRAVPTIVPNVAVDVSAKLHGCVSSKKRTLNRSVKTFQAKKIISCRDPIFFCPRFNMKFHRPPTPDQHAGRADEMRFIDCSTTARSMIQGKMRRDLAEAIACGIAEYAGKRGHKIQ